MTAVSNDVHTLLRPENCAVVFIDHQPQMTFGVANIDRQLLVNNTLGLAKAAKLFEVPTILTTVETESFSGFMWPQLLDIFPDHTPIERTSMNSWDDEGFRKAVAATGKKKIVIAALWTEVCLAFPTIEMLQEGYEIYMVLDACGGTSEMAHDYTVQRLVQAGAVPMTWIQFLLEMQRDWAHKESYDAVTHLVREHGGAYGQGIEYAATRLHGMEPNRLQTV